MSKNNSTISIFQLICQLINKGFYEIHRPPTHRPPPTYHRSLTHRPIGQPTTDPPTHLQNNHRPNRQDFISKTWLIKNIHFTERKQLGRCKTMLRSIIYLMNRYLYEISIYFIKFLSLVFFKTNYFSVKYIRRI